MDMDRLTLTVSTGLALLMLLPLLDQYQPRYLVHGHIHQRYGANRPRCCQYGETTIVNATGRYILEFPDKKEENKT